MIGHDPQKSHARPNKDLEKEATEVWKIGTHMDDSAGAYNLKPPALTDSEYDSESDVESDTNDGPLMTTVFKEGLWFAKNSDVLVENKVQTGSTVSNKTRLGMPSKKKTDLRTLSQRVGGGPDQIPKFVVCEIGT